MPVACMRSSIRAKHLWFKTTRLLKQKIGKIKILPDIKPWNARLGQAGIRNALKENHKTRN
ncbi:hypothetical protein [Alkanindiges illinoisensis]|uniref:hypothetical protein n=1 Tax=Alkanindiges illinoisensis TaxID=197183 RepID=UPI00047A26D6